MTMVYLGGDLRLWMKRPEVCMDTIICDIAKKRMEKDFNEALQYLGLFVSAIRFDDSAGLSVILEISVFKGNTSCA